MSASPQDLHLYEEYLLLALRDDTGTPETGVSLGFGLSGALLADLLLLERVEVEQEGKKSFLKLIDMAPTGDSLLDDCMVKVQTAKRRAQLTTWVQRFASISKLKHRAAASLCDRGVLKLEESRFLLLFTREVYPEVDGRVEKEILARLKKAIFTQTREITPRTLVLVSLANSTGMLRANFDKKKLKERKARIEKIVSGEAVGEAAQKAVQAAVQAATMAAIMPAIMTTTVIASS
ncbi:MAG: GPP34 family phosphoprotein [Planctomycetes bacterium]|nr:GPP34 family phosphoprotein [Planctomycetota bacterium]MCP4770753.1 GPP34 family phosphoprotein [Planctomycetota bacterium]MCP4862176.1 GPP34 family phosphoprotein [Planctomycetota bacterium]